MLPLIWAAAAAAPEIAGEIAVAVAGSVAYDACKTMFETTTDAGTSAAAAETAAAAAQTAAESGSEDIAFIRNEIDESVVGTFAYEMVAFAQWFAYGYIDGVSLTTMLTDTEYYTGAIVDLVQRLPAPTLATEVNAIKTLVELLRDSLTSGYSLDAAGVALYETEIASGDAAGTGLIVLRKIAGEWGWALNPKLLTTTPNGTEYYPVPGLIVDMLAASVLFRG